MQVAEDYKASEKMFNFSSPSEKRAYHVGVVMAILTMEGFAEREDIRIAPTVPECIEAYLRAAKRAIGAS